MGADQYNYYQLIFILAMLLGNCYNYSNMAAWGAEDAPPGGGGKCGEEFQKVTACLMYATGKAASPSKECCEAAADLKEKDPACLCYIVQQIHDGSKPQIKNMGIQEARLLQLPSACNIANASTSASECPKLLHLPPNSPDAAFFNNATASLTNTSTTPAGGTTTMSTRSNGSNDRSQLVAVAIIAVFLWAAFPAGLV